MTIAQLVHICLDVAQAVLGVILGYAVAAWRHRLDARIREELLEAKRLLADMTVNVGVDEALDDKLAGVPDSIKAAINQHLGALRRQLADDIGVLQRLVRDSIGRQESDREAQAAARVQMHAVAEDITKTLRAVLDAVKHLEKAWTE